MKADDWAPPSEKEPAAFCAAGEKAGWERWRDGGAGST